MSLYRDEESPGPDLLPSEKPATCAKVVTCCGGLKTGSCCDEDSTRSVRKHDRSPALDVELADGVRKGRFQNEAVQSGSLSLSQIVLVEDEPGFPLNRQILKRTYH